MNELNKLYQGSKCISFQFLVARCFHFVEQKLLRSFTFEEGRNFCLQNQNTESFMFSHQLSRTWDI